jgi:hypothetical protein
MKIGPASNAYKEHRDHETVNCDNPDANNQVRLEIR